MKYFTKTGIFSIGVMLFTVHLAHVQRRDIQHFRYYDQRGINIFETSKTDTLV